MNTSCASLIFDLYFLQFDVHITYLSYFYAIRGERTAHKPKVSVLRYAVTRGGVPRRTRTIYLCVLYLYRSATVSLTLSRIISRFNICLLNVVDYCYNYNIYILTLFSFIYRLYFIYIFKAGAGRGAAGARPETCDDLREFLITHFALSFQNRNRSCQDLPLSDANSQCIAFAPLVM